MDARTQHALTVIARITGGDPSRPIPVRALGLAHLTGHPADPENTTGCLVYSVNTILAADYADHFDAGRSEALGLVEAVLDGPALAGQPFVFSGPLSHYVTHGTVDLFDTGQPGNLRLPVAAPTADGRWVIANGTHRYAAGHLLGDRPRMLLVTETPGCRCPVRHRRAPILR